MSPIDYRRFLGAASTEVLPYLGGPAVDSADRRLRIEGERVAPGWWRFDVAGRTARPVAPASPPDLSHLPAVRGHHVGGYLMGPQARGELLLLASSEPELFEPVIGRRWPSGDLLFDGVDFATGPEDAVRQAFEDGQPLPDVPGTPATLRAAFAFAVAVRAGAAHGVRVAPAEIRPYIKELLGPAEAADAVVRRIAARRATARLMRRSGRAGRRPGPVEDRVDDALAAAGAAPLGLRALDDGLVEVRFRFMGERFTAVVESASLNVVDAGICLSGEDRLLTLDSLPSAIREAIEDDVLVITR